MGIYPKVAHLFDDSCIAVHSMRDGKQVEFLPLEDDEICVFNCKKCSAVICNVGMVNDYIFDKYFAEIWSSNED